MEERLPLQFRTMDDVKDDDKSSATTEGSTDAKAAPEANGADAKDLAEIEALASVFAETATPSTSTTNGEAPKPPETSPRVESAPPAPAGPSGGIATPTKEVEPVQSISRPPVVNDKESELTTLSGLMLIGLAAAMFYVGTVVFAKDSLIFFAGIFVYLIVAPPGTYAQGKSKMVSFTKEVAIAFALTFVLFVILKSALPADADQAQLFTVVLAVLGIKLVHFPYYNTKNEEDE